MTDEEYLSTLDLEQLKRIHAALVNMYAEEVQPGCLAEGELTVAEVEFAKQCAPDFHKAFPMLDFGGKNLYRTALVLREWARLNPGLRQAQRIFAAWSEPASTC